MSPKTFTTSQAAKQIGVSRQTLQAWIASRGIKAPELIGSGKATLRLWTNADVARAKKFKGSLRAGRPAKKNRK